MNWSYQERNRIGDHIWWVSDTRKFKLQYPDWHQVYNLERIMSELQDRLMERLG